MLAAYDRGVQAAYRTVLGWRADPTTRTKQRAWLRERDGCADTICLRRAYEGRLAALFEAVPERLAVPRPDRSGRLTMLPIGSGDYAFHLSAFYRGQTPGGTNIGDATGVVRVRGGSGTYRGETCSITFEAAPRGRGWLVRTSDDTGCGAWAGVRLSGSFVR